MNRNFPAFPRPASEYTAHGTCPDGNDPELAQDGMSLRDYFAAAALTGIIGNGSDWDPMQAAALAYQTAEAMLKARES